MSKENFQKIKLLKLWSCCAEIATKNIRWIRLLILRNRIISVSVVTGRRYITMIGAIIGNIVGSIYEFNNHRSKDFEFFGKGCKITDDSIMTIAIAKALMESKKDYSDLGEQAVKWMREIGQKYPSCGYGFRFY